MLIIETKSEFPRGPEPNREPRGGPRSAGQTDLSHPHWDYPTNRLQNSKLGPEFFRLNHASATESNPLKTATRSSELGGEPLKRP